MCGIAGIKLFNSRPTISQEEKLRAAIALQNHRGPDHSAVTSEGEFILGHNRLSIIDTDARSHQPMWSADRKYGIVFNGEIYNFLSLKAELINLGYQFNTSSDTEVLLHFIRHFGTSDLHRLNGCFAFCYVEPETGYMLLARDSMGIKPLFYWVSDKHLMFSSELHVLRKLGLPLEIDQNALSAYFQYSFVPRHLTMLKGASRLLPGHFLEHRSELRIQSFRQQTSESLRSHDFRSAVVETRELVTEAVREQLVSDVPIGSFLSGGIDSSVISLIAAREKADLRTFSIGFPENGLLDEGQQAAETAKFIGSRHTKIELTTNQVIDELPQVLNAFDEPFADSSAIAMYFLTRETAREITVALSGDGADELFGGYNRYKAFLRAETLQPWQKLLLKTATLLGKGHREGKLANVVRQAKKMDAYFRLEPPENLNLLASMIDYDAGERILRNYSRYKLYESSPGTINELLRLDQDTILPGDMLRKTDGMSMAHSLEVRTPFLHEPLFRAVNSFPSEWKTDGRTTKILLREAFKSDLSAELFDRPKHGFEVPLAKWLQQFNFQQRYPEFFSEDFLKEQDIFDYPAINSVIQNFHAGSKTDAALIWAYLSFQVWYQRMQEL